ncbi:MAG: HypC/HybG/HupF family hydrogenase formation chaperone [Planctomycetes bacterium]|nr:HypC/HybG/HupF family hydrogenase formation chaperone [Planctomycetota bacterium]
MCLSIPMKLIRGDEYSGTAEVDGVQREVSLMLLPEVANVGDWLLVHAGYAIGVVDEKEAALTLQLLRAAANDEVHVWENDK